MTTDKLIYDWNRVEGPELKLSATPMLDDETLRDGLQSPSALDPPLEKKIRILHRMEVLGIDSVNLGLPGARVGPGLAPACLRQVGEAAPSDGPTRAGKPGCGHTSRLLLE